MPGLSLFSLPRLTYAEKDKKVFLILDRLSRLTFFLKYL